MSASDHLRCEHGIPEELCSRCVPDHDCTDECVTENGFVKHLIRWLPDTFPENLPEMTVAEYCEYRQQYLRET